LYFYCLLGANFKLVNFNFCSFILTVNWTNEQCYLHIHLMIFTSYFLWKFSKYFIVRDNISSEWICVLFCLWCVFVVWKVINLFNFFRNFKSPLFHTVIRIHLISLSYHILVFAISFYFYGASANVSVSVTNMYIVLSFAICEPVYITRPPVTNDLFVLTWGYTLTKTKHRCLKIFIFII